MTQSNGSETPHLVIDAEVATKVAKSISRLIDSKKNDVINLQLVNDIGSLHKQLVVLKKELSEATSAEKSSLIGYKIRKSLMCISDTTELLELQVPEIINPRKLVNNGVKALQAEVLALVEEFPEGAVFVPDMGTHGALMVTTTAVELEGIKLGRFNIIYPIGGLSEVRNKWCTFIAEGLEPNESGDGYEHPHVESGRICLGQGSDAIFSAMEIGRAHV